MDAWINKFIHFGTGLKLLIQFKKNGLNLYVKFQTVTLSNVLEYTAHFFEFSEVLDVYSKIKDTEVKLSSLAVAVA